MWAVSKSCTVPSWRLVNKSYLVSLFNRSVSLVNKSFGILIFFNVGRFAVCYLSPFASFFFYRSLYNGLVAGLQRQMCFAGIRIGLYDSIKAIYQQQLDRISSPRNKTSHNGGANISVRILAGITTGGLAVLFAQPTDVVKVRMQAQVKTPGGPPPRYTGCFNAYSSTFPFTFYINLMD